MITAEELLNKFHERDAHGAVFVKIQIPGVPDDDTESYQRGVLDCLVMLGLAEYCRPQPKEPWGMSKYRLLPETVKKLQAKQTAHNISK